MLRSSGVLLDDEQLLEQHEPEMLSTHPTDAVATDSVLLAILGTMILPKDDDEDTPVIVYSGSQQSNMFLRSAYDVLALHLRGLPPPPDHVWRMVRYNARGKLETWRPRVNQQQIKCIVGARLPAKDDEWAAVLTALTEHRDILKSPPEHVLHVLKTYARNLQNVWRNRSLSSASTRPTTASPAKRTAADMQAEQQHSQQCMCDEPISSTKRHHSPTQPRPSSHQACPCRGSRCHRAPLPLLHGTCHPQYQCQTLRHPPHRVPQPLLSKHAAPRLTTHSCQPPCKLARFACQSSPCTAVTCLPTR